MSTSDVEPIKTLPLVFDEPRGRKKPPRHLADLDEAGRKALLEEMGLPGFRAKQLSMHYFGRLADDPAAMTDLPAGQRDELVSALLPDLMTPLRTLEADRGTTRKTLWKLFDGALVVPIAMLVKRKTRRFAQFMFVGMVVTALVVLGVASLVLYFMVDA